MNQCSRTDRRRFSSPNGGFTIVELAVVTSITAVLVAALIPALGRARGEAQGMSCLSQHKQFAMLFIMYGADNSDRFPMFADYYQPPTNGTHWFQVIAPYAGEDPNTILTSQIRVCPSGKAGVGAHYGAFKPVGPPFPVPLPSAPIVYGNFGPLLFSDVNCPSTWAMLLDTGIQHHFMYTYNNWSPDVDTDSDSFPDTDLGVMAHFGAGGQYNGARPRVHCDLTSMAMVDGHAERLDFHAFLGQWNGATYEPHDFFRDDF